MTPKARAPEEAKAKAPTGKTQEAMAPETMTPEASAPRGRLQEDVVPEKWRQKPRRQWAGHKKL
jgi:hypothetical protein